MNGPWATCSPWWVKLQPAASASAWGTEIIIRTWTNLILGPKLGNGNLVTHMSSSLSTLKCYLVGSWAECLVFRCPVWGRDSLIPGSWWPGTSKSSACSWVVPGLSWFRAPTQLYISLTPEQSRVLNHYLSWQGEWLLGSAIITQLNECSSCLWHLNMI